MDFQSQLRSALKTRTPGQGPSGSISSIQSTTKKSDVEDSTDSLSGGSLRDRWKNMEKQTTSPSTGNLSARGPSRTPTVRIPSGTTPTVAGATSPLPPATASGTEPPMPALSRKPSARVAATADQTESEASNVSISQDIPVPAAPILPPAPGIIPGTTVTVLADYVSGGEGQLSLTAGDTLKVLKWDYGNGWAFGQTLDMKSSGVFPQTYVSRTM
ncbi:hypothetical protein DFS34DRAFT_626528 [Phlyctochytrium arcticum]|nr:hypothetical protein DFS34DRAFT_626528 [Phlyctochytrium arcticum]